jgi:hypothetical protein
MAAPVEFNSMTVPAVMSVIHRFPPASMAKEPGVSALEELPLTA